MLVNLEAWADVTLDGFREEGRLAADRVFAARFSGAAGTAPGAFRFFDGC